jgi:two-component system LytT family response regulator
METMNVNYPGYIKPSTEPVIVLPTCKGTIVIPVQHIIRIQSFSNYSKLFFFNGKTLVVAKVLRWFQEQTVLCSFVRVHRTHFINTSYIKSYSGNKAGLLFLQNGEIISVAKRKKTGLAERLNNLHYSFTDTSVNTSPFYIKKIMAA